MNYKNATPDFPSDAEVAKGMHLSFCNAASLKEEADILAAAGHTARAVALLILSLEELGKIPLIFGALSMRRRSGYSAKDFWRKLSWHQPKQEIWALYGSILEASGAPAAISFSPRLPQDIGSTLDRAKQRCFYTDSTEGTFEAPSTFESTNPDLLPWLNLLVDSRLESFRPLHGELRFSQRMVEDFVRQIDPQRRTSEDEAHIARMKALGFGDIYEECLLDSRQTDGSTPAT